MQFLDCTSHISGVASGCRIWLQNIVKHRTQEHCSLSVSCVWKSTWGQGRCMKDAPKCLVWILVQKRYLVVIKSIILGLE